MQANMSHDRHEGTYNAVGLLLEDLLYCLSHVRQTSAKFMTSFSVSIDPSGYQWKPHMALNQVTLQAGKVREPNLYQQQCLAHAALVMHA